MLHWCLCSSRRLKILQFKLKSTSPLTNDLVEGTSDHGDFSLEPDRDKVVGVAAVANRSGRFIPFRLDCSVTETLSTL